MIQVQNLALTLEEKQVFSGIDFQVSGGDFFLIKGKSGSGKSLLLQIMAGLMPEIIEGDLSGTIRVMDKDPTKEGVVGMAGDLAYLMQDPDSQLCTFTVKDEILFGMENLKFSKETMQKRLDHVLRLFQIEDLKDRTISELSGGQKQKVCFASLYVMDSEIFLLDEPTANLDPQSARDIIDIACRLVHDEGKTVVLVEHNHHYAKSFVNKVYDMDRKILVTKNVETYIDVYLEDFELPTVDFKHGDKIILEGRNLSHRYRDLRVFHDIDLNLREGEILALIGESGSGKSTLANILTGLMKPSAGTVTIDGRSLADLSTMEIGNSIGLVFQNPEHQFIKYNVWDELALNLVTRHCDEKVIQERVERFLKRFNLADKADANPYELSQGEKRKLSTASMLITGQKVLILDEPTYGQDRENLIQLLNLLFEVAKSGVAIILISHDMELVKHCCHRALVMKDGSLENYRGGGNDESV